MQLETIRFGLVDIDEDKLITFDEGIPGLDMLKKYALLQFEESYPIIWLQSVDEGRVCLPVLDTFAVLTGYVFDIDDEDVKILELNGPDDLHVVSVLVIPEEIQRMTVNLAAPIIINTVTGKAKQILLSGTDYNVRAPVFSDIYKVIAREEVATDAGSVAETERNDCNR
ncbi:MAG: flagellar assembly protein FliW [Oscillospiraceae bacterium]|nr:flagellar assembly protein FliW [Oscillospiraceae bacterium]